jgi:hypothetical protein
MEMEKARSMTSHARIAGGLVPVRLGGKNEGIGEGKDTVLPAMLSMPASSPVGICREGDGDNMKDSRLLPGVIAPAPGLSIRI